MVLNQGASTKTLVTRGGFWLLRGKRSVGESIKKVEFVTKIFFLAMVSGVLKTCKKSYLLMYIKAKVKQQETKGVVVSCYFHVIISCCFDKKYLQNLRHNVKQACILYLIVFGSPSSLILSFKNTRILIAQNLLKA